MMTLLLLGACASKPPDAISKAPHHNPSLTQVRLEIDRYLGAELRWGGKISKIENRAEDTWIEIVQMPLSARAKPLSSGKSDGRFIASFDKFVDPVVYEVGRKLTVVGTIDGKVRRAIGEYDYLFPIVKVEGSFLWKVTPPVYSHPYPPPWGYYDPWYYPGPYYHRHPRYH